MRASSEDIASLRDGSKVRIRQVDPVDADALLALMQSLAPESRRLQFLTAACDVGTAARWAAKADGVQHIGFVALDTSGMIVGHAACVRLYGPRAEVAVELDVHHRHLGLAALLLRRLADDAKRQGIRRLIAEVELENLELLFGFHDEFRASEHDVDRGIDRGGQRVLAASWLRPSR